MFFDTESVSKRKSELSITIGLMRDDIIFLKFTTKPHLHEMFLEHLQPSCCFHEVILCVSVPWEFVFLKIYQSHFEIEACW